MAQEQQIIYVEGKGFVPIASGQSVQDAIAMAPQGGGGERAKLGMTGPGDQFAGLDLPAEGMREAGGSAAKAVPQLAGLAAQFTPVGKMGFTGAAAVPMVIDAIQQLMEGKQFDAGRSAQEGFEGMAGHGVGRAIGGLGKTGVGVVRRSLNLGSGPFAGNEVAEQVIPAKAIAEKAQMTIPGVQAVKDKAAATGNGVLADLAEALQKARYDAANSPNFQGGGLMSMLMHLIDPPKQMKIGSAMAAPFGVDTAKTIAPAAEGGTRALMAWLESQLGGGASSPSGEAPSGPQRRKLPQ